MSIFFITYRRNVYGEIFFLLQRESSRRRFERDRREKLRRSLDPITGSYYRRCLCLFKTLIVSNFLSRFSGVFLFFFYVAGSA